MCGRFGRIFGTRLYEKLEKFVFFICMEWKRCVRIVRGYFLNGVGNMRPNRPGLWAVAGGFFRNDTVWDGMRHGTVIPEVAMGTWQTVEAAALNAG